MKISFTPVILLFMIAAFSISGFSKQKAPEISLSSILNPISETSYTIDYKISITGIEPAAFSDQKINFPYESSIIEGMTMNGKLSEKDFLYSERNIDLNNDGDTDDFFPFSYKEGSIIISGSPVNPIIKKNNGNYLLLPSDNKNRENSARVTPEGRPFTIHSFDPQAGKIKAGLNEPADNKIYRDFSNSLLVIEVIPDAEDNLSGIQINGVKPDKGFTNEKIFTPEGGNRERFFTAFNINLSGNSGSGNAAIDNLRGNFKVRVRYYFSISSRVILFDEKIITYKKK